MKLSIISPIKFLEFSALTNYQLVLAHLLKNERYKQFYKFLRKRGDYLVIDNGVYETTIPMDVERVLDYADEINAQEIILPDYRFDYKETKSAVFKALQNKKVYHSKRKLAACVQGNNQKEWIKCLDDFMKVDRIDTICLQKGICRDFKNYRIEICAYINEMKYYKKKQFHLLGTCSNPIEIDILNNKFKWIRGVDTKAPIFYGNAMNIKYDKENGVDILIKIDESHYFETEKIYHQDTILHNIYCLIEWSGCYDD